MICDKKLLAIVNFCEGEKGYRESLKYIHFHDNYAEVTNGHIYVKVDFPEHSDDSNFDFVIGEKALLSHIGKDVLIHPSYVKRIFSFMLKKGSYFLKDKILIGSDEEGNSVLRYCREDAIIIDEKLVIPKDLLYPNVSSVIPVLEEDDIVNIGIVAENLLLLSKMGIFDHNSYNVVNFKIKKEKFCKTGILFSISDNISGVVMPYIVRK